jgi:hypothetical protein
MVRPLWKCCKEPVYWFVVIATVAVLDNIHTKIVLIEMSNRVAKFDRLTDMYRYFGVAGATKDGSVLLLQTLDTKGDDEVIPYDDEIAYDFYTPLGRYKGKERPDEQRVRRAEQIARMGGPNRVWKIPKRNDNRDSAEGPELLAVGAAGSGSLRSTGRRGEGG